MSAWIEIWNGLAGAWGNAIIRASWQGGIAIVLVWTICHLFPKIPARLRCWMWRLAYLKMLVALLWIAPVDLPLLPAAQHSSPAVPSVVTGILKPFSIPSAPGMHSAKMPAVSGGVFLLWLLGVGRYSIWLARDWKKTQRLYLSCKSVEDDRIRSSCAEFCRRYGLSRLPRLMSSEEINSPVLIGAFRPAIILPSSLLAGCTPDQLRLVLAHELAHIQRRDLLWNGLPALAQGLFFFHPLVWLAYREWRLAQEMACDEMTVRMTNASIGEYGEVILKVATQNGPDARLRWMTAGIAESRRTLKRRLIAMKHAGSVSRNWLVFGGATLALLAVVGIVPWRIVAQGKATDKSKAAKTPRAVHVVAEGPNRKMEYWLVDGLGMRAEVIEGKRRQVMVYNLQKFYEYDLSRNRVTIRVGDPDEMKNGMAFFTASGARKELEQRLGSKKGMLREEKVVFKGRNLLKLHAPGSGIEDAFFIDPGTGLVTMMRERQPDGIALTYPYIIDYPNPKSISPALFKFKIPQGAQVNDLTAQGDVSSPRMITCVSNLRQIATALLVYEREHGRLPEHLQPDLEVYLKNASIFICPSAPQDAKESGTISYLYMRPADRIADIPVPSETVLVECRHHKWPVRAYADGHVKIADGQGN